MGRFDEARTWYARAVASAEKGDRDGRVDHENLSQSLRRTGDCLLETGQLREAQSWYERAAEHAQQGDIQGRVNYEGLGQSLHQVAHCLARMEDHEQAYQYCSVPSRPSEKATSMAGSIMIAWASACTVSATAFPPGPAR